MDQYKHQPTQPRKTPAPARQCAIQALMLLEAETSAFCAETLDMFIKRDNLSPADARLASNIAYKTLRSAYYLDSCFQHHLKQPIESLQPGTRWLLRMAACQAILLDRIPPHAIADDSVELARHTLKLKPAALGFINAVVRKILKTAPNARQALETERQPGPKLKMPIDAISVRLSLPAWICRYFIKAFGAKSAWSLFDALNTEPALVIRANTLRTAPEILTEALAGLGGIVTPSELLPEALMVSGLPAASLIASKEFADGHFYIQDQASQIVSRLLQPVPGESILDYCAAPGGKATHLFQLAQGKAAVTAHDTSPSRVKLLKENLARLQMPEITISEKLAPSDMFDAVLVDAPCSGLGTIRRNPEIRYRLEPSHLVEHAGKQLAILRAAASHVKPGGRLAYSTCSVTAEENAMVIQRFLKSHPDFSVVPPLNALPAIQALEQPDGFYRTWPACPELDGFEAVILRRSA